MRCCFRFRAVLLVTWLAALLLPAGRVMAAPTAPAGARRVALVIGNAKYEPAVGPLRNPVNDAKAVGAALRGLGFTVIEEHNVTREKLLKAVVQFRAGIQEAEVALFYFAGHGIQVAGSNYLLPVKSGYEPAGAADATLRLLAETKLFNAEQAVAEMSAAGARCNLVILDACRSTPVARNPRSRDASAPAGGLAEMQPPAGSLIAFATDAGHTANDGEGGNGLYTAELLKNLRTPGLTIEQVFKRTRAAVLEASMGSQLPAEYSRLIGDDIYLAGPRPADVALPPAATPGSQIQPEKDRAAEPPNPQEINRLAAAGETVKCLTALRALAASRGPGDFATGPLEVLLDRVKETLKEATETSPVLGIQRDSCQAILEALPECLPPGHAKLPELTAKAQNRLGDCLLLLSQAAEALKAYQAALELAPEDAYIRYNRGRAQLALGKQEEAKSDFTAAAGMAGKKQPGARKLAQEALTRLKSKAAG